jgi:adenine/guanine phosphoribosyltransferase-like PRPP-binding protein
MTVLTSPFAYQGEDGGVDHFTGIPGRWERVLIIDDFSPLATINGLARLAHAAGAVVVGTAL